MRTDSFFYTLFSTEPRAFFALIGANTINADDYTFTAIEIKEMSFRHDGVFMPSVADEPMYYVEIQYQPDEDFYGRFIAEIALHLYQTKPPNDWFAVVIFPSRSVDRGIPRRYDVFESSGKLRRLYLNEMSDEVFTPYPLSLLPIISAPEPRVETLVHKVLDSLQAEDYLHQQQGKDLLRKLLSYKLPHLTIERIEAMMDIFDFEEKVRQSRAYRDIEERGLRKGLDEGLEKGLREGLQQGLQQGIQQGVQQGRQIYAQQTALRMLNKRFPISEIAELTGLSEEEVRSLQAS
jgi:predicted transposase/invertase (TIGR01784 family)